MDDAAKADEIKTKQESMEGEDTHAKNIIEFCLKDVQGSDFLVSHFAASVKDMTPEQILANCKVELQILQKRDNKKLKEKLFNDPIHGSMMLNELEFKMLNTEEFHRLKSIKQLGGKSYVYPGAVHTRFEHSIGVCYLAGEFIRYLNEGRGEWFNQEEAKCVRLAGLCHDLGHGPFSHVFEAVKKEILGEEDAKKIKHEKISALMFKKILLDYPELLALFVFSKLEVEHVENICDMIDCSETLMDNMEKDDRKKKKVYLYEIVANKKSGLDVDKMDYFARDCYFLGVKNEFITKRCMTLSKIIECENGSFHICFREKECHNIYGFFRTRYLIHQKACSHKVVSAIEMMIKDAIVAGQDLNLFGWHSSPISIKTALESVLKTPADLSGFLDLSDDILNRILKYSDGISTAQVIVKRIMCRKTYNIVGENIYPTKQMLEILQLSNLAHEHCTDWKPSMLLSPDWKTNLKDMHHKKIDVGGGEKIEYEIDCAFISYASERKVDPVKDVLFYNKEHKVIPIKESYVTIPKSFVEYRVRLFRKNSESSSENDKDAMRWFEEECENALTAILPPEEAKDSEM